jgi:uracil phosphoribosyltransferase
MSGVLGNHRPANHDECDRLTRLLRGHREKRRRHKEQVLHVFAIVPFDSGPARPTCPTAVLPLAPLLPYSYRVPVHLVDHPLVHDALVSLRDKQTSPEAFRRAATRISVLLAAEALRDVPTRNVTVETPLSPASGRTIAREVVVVPVLRAGLGMLDAVLELVPDARVGHIGLQRDEMTAVASQYYSKLPARLDSSFVLMIDPMLATGGSAVAALDLLHRAGASLIRMICIVAAPEGVALVERHHPGVAIYTPVIDTRLNEHKYIVPGLGDFGDRLYGTL